MEIYYLLLVMTPLSLQLEVGLNDRICPEQQSNTYYSACYDCDVITALNVTCKENETQVSTKSCHTLESWNPRVIIPGCLIGCMYNVSVVQCCPGFWGVDCIECPSENDVPCSGHGTCDDLIEGTGYCKCQDGFKGTSCEECSDKLMFGEECDKRCTCVNGFCNSGYKGDGLCYCQEGFTGQNCDEEERSCKTLSCHTNAHCIYEDPAKTQPKCVCNGGYSGNGTLCTEIDLCENKNPCHVNATCTHHHGKWILTCKCFDGHKGDGYFCQAIDPCQTDFGGCDTDTADCIYLSPNKSECVCLDGYNNLDGKSCELEDVCLKRQDECDQNANCTTVGPNELTCTCNEGFIGDGAFCYGNILQRLHDLNNEGDMKNKLNKAIQLVTFAYKEEITSVGPLTLFIAQDFGFQILSRQGVQSMFRDIYSNRNYGQLMLRNHLVGKSWTFDENSNTTSVYTLYGTRLDLLSQDGVIVLKSGNTIKPVVLKSNVIASNGVVHIIDRMMENMPKIPVQSQHSTMTVLQKNFKSLSDLLKKTELLSDFMKLRPGQETLFLPTNDVFSKLPPGTKEHLVDPNEINKLKAIVYNHMFVGEKKLQAFDFVKGGKFTSIGQTTNVYSISDNGQICLRNGASIPDSCVNITQTDISTSDGMIHTIDGLLLPDTIDTLLPKHCDQIAEQVLGPCAPCSRELKCASEKHTPTDDIRKDCSVTILNKPNIKIVFSGCRRVCNQINKKCCDGFYGPECYPCPGGFQNPCFGRGQCSDGILGNGSCECYSEYTGTVCQYCTDTDKYGQYCNKTCKCLHGECDNSVDGSLSFLGEGRCKFFSCKPGYKGSYCELQTMRCGNLHCHAHAECVRRKDRRDMIFNLFDNYRFRRRNRRRRKKGRAYCTCKEGYTGTGYQCKEINLCESGLHICHPEAACIHTGPANATCECNTGWVGDGYYCYPSTPCKENKACHPDAKCMEPSPGKAVCQCNFGFHGNGSYCVPIDMCKVRNGGCDKNASCTSTGPGEVNCTCNANLGGNGYYCFGNIPHEVEGRTELQQLLRLIQKIPSKDDFLNDISRNYTFFAPNNTAVMTFLSDVDSAWTKEENLLTLLKFHTLPQVLTLDNLDNLTEQSLIPLASDFQMNITTDSDGILINKASIMTGDILALNGIIHIIDSVLEPTPPPFVLPGLEDILTKQAQFSIFLFYLKQTGLLGKMKTIPSYTVLAPVDNAWRSFNQKLITEKYLSCFIIKNEELEKVDLQSKGNKTLSTLLGRTLAVYSEGTKIYINGAETNISVPDLGIKSGFIQGIDSLLTPVLNYCSVRPPLCCKGYYGTRCQGCPGGTSSPCSNHGKCNDGILGDGSCSCYPGYTGPSCDECSGWGQCKLDPCKVNNGGCSPFAKCESQSLQVKCTCMFGFVGDGVKCQYPCDVDNGQCHPNATCSLEKSVTRCQCNTHYTGDGYLCELQIENCDYLNGGCLPQALCSLVNGKISCNCQPNHVGDGVTQCTGDLWQALQDIQDKIPTDFIKNIMNTEVQKMLQDHSRMYTVFVPVDNNVRLSEPSSYIVNGFILLNNSINSGITVKSVSGGSIVITVDYNNSETDELEFKANGYRIIEKDIKATNGIIHLLNNFSVNIEDTDSKTTPPLMKEHHIVVGIVVGMVLLVIVVTVIVLVVWRKHDVIAETVSQIRNSSRFSFHKFVDESASSISFHSSVFEDSAVNITGGEDTEKQPLE